MSIGVVTPYFDMIKSDQRQRNYIRHRESLTKVGVRHLTVEIQVPGRDFVLSGLPDVVCLRTDLAKWHKTNCINIGAKVLAKLGCRIIAWIDADCILRDADWPNRAEDALRKHDIVQLQSHIICSEQPTKLRKSWVAGGYRGRSRQMDGGGWAARSEFFEQVGYFDCVVSGANKAIITPLQREVWPKGDIAYMAALDRYAQKASKYVRSVTYLLQAALDLNHGSRQRRGSLSADRFEMLAKHRFDFDRDCYYDDNGVIQWTNPEGAIARAVADYTKERESCENMDVESTIDADSH